jgi:hypothetical protein
MNKIPCNRSGSREAHIHLYTRTYGQPIYKKYFCICGGGWKTCKSVRVSRSIISRSQYILIRVNFKVNGGSRLYVLGGNCCLSNKYVSLACIFLYRHWRAGIWLPHWCERRDWRFWMRAYNEREFYFPCPWQNNNDARNDRRMETSFYKYGDEIKILKFSHQCLLAHGLFLR